MNVKQLGGNYACKMSHPSPGFS